MGSRVGFSGGFTLFELLVVVIVVGILASFVMPTLSVRDDGQRLEQSVDVLVAAMELQEEEAVLTGTQRGLRFYERLDERNVRFHYQWLIWSGVDGRWLLQEGRGATGSLDGAVSWGLEVEGREVALKATGPVVQGDEEGGEGDRTRGPQPQLVVLSSGEVSTFELHLETAGGPGSGRLAGAYEGLRWLRRDEDGR